MSSARAFCFSGNRDVVNRKHDITMTNTIERPVLSSRQKTAGPNHHLWNNHGTWWFHGTFHLPDGTAERVRVNLKTADLKAARLRRDHIITGRCFQTPTQAA